MRNQVNKLGQRLKKDCPTRSITGAEGNTKSTWQAIDKLTNRRFKPADISYIVITGGAITEPKDKIEALNNYFPL